MVGLVDAGQGRPSQVRPAVTERNLCIPALDGYRLAATVFEPTGSEDRKVVAQINGATGVWRRFYRYYARFLASRGFHVVTYDYRGTGDSLDASWEGASPRLQDWGEQDLAGVIEWVSSEYPEHRPVCIGHSLGGPLFGLAHNNWRVWAQLGVVAHAGYWRHFRAREWPRLLFHWYCLVPFLARMLGRLPGHQSDYSEDLPARVALDWARWSRHPAYCCDPRGRPLRQYFRAYRGRMRFYAFADDEPRAPAAAVRALASCFENADVQIMHIAPADFGADAIGHFGFFREQMPAQAWQRSVDWLLAAVHANVRQSLD